MPKAKYTLATLTLAYVFSIMDRQLLTLLVGPIQADLQISDTLVGLLHGFTFALFYGLVGLPIARLVDRGNRRLLISSGILLWCVATAASGFASTYMHLLIARVFVAVGEAVLLPAAISLIADIFTPQNRHKALGVFGAGGPFGAGFGLLVGGLLLATLPSLLNALPLGQSFSSWQLTFVVIGSSGIIVAAMMFFSFEPREQGLSGSPSAQTRDRVSTRSLVTFMREHKVTYVGVLIGSSFFYLSVYGASTWIPSYFVRSHHWQYSTFGMVFGSLLCVIGPVGAYFGSALGAQLESRGYSQPNLKAAALGSLALFVCTCGVILSPSATLALLFLSGNAVFWFFLFGLGPGLVLDIAPESMRGQVMALFTGLLNLIGAGSGPVAVGYISDHYFTEGNGLGVAILITAVISVVVSLSLFYLASKQFSQTQTAALAARDPGINFMAPQSR